MNPIVLYVSQTGFTQRYAQWIAEELPCAALPLRQASAAALEAYDTFVCGTWIKDDQLVDMRKFLRLVQKMQEKRFLFFYTGGVPQEEGRYKSLSARSGGRRFPLFYCPGGLCYEKMSNWDKRLMALVRMRLKNSVDPQQVAQGKRFGSSYDLSDRSYLVPLLTAVREGWEQPLEMVPPTEPSKGNP